MKRGLSIIFGAGLLLASFGCFVEYRDDDRGRQHEYREHDERRGGDHDRDYDSGRDRDERRDYYDRR
jgi:hypothetical protein